MLKRNNDKPFFLYLGVCLLVLYFVSNVLLGGLYARFTTKDNSGDASRVAKFAVVDGGLFTDVSYLQVNIKPETEQIFYYDIVNNSEVAVRVILTPKNVTENLPLVLATVTEDFTPGQNKKIALKFAWSEKSLNGLPFDSPEYAGKMDLIKVTIQVEQID